ncbi:CopG family antitoxin [Bdellovibrio bacteriovorus]|uniref:Uncharacterized protein n=1 Tax=Bdellovibrio bacteriovorus str. Tiberius TaxID=1069642 RepID=K7Z9V2_BDEBC|nr:CopG family antitoxin [Bdellovibrio bacteriovorus]AFY01354.1 Hypothetical protein Bdt_1659 [Bdellovibrio bacteriovorus str. Tiberius]
MKRNKISPEEAVEFIESFNKMIHDKDEPTEAISLRIPANLLRALKTTAKIQDTKYQSLIVKFIREGLKNS